MTEQDWFECDAPGWMAGQLALHQQTRKARLYLVSIARFGWRVLAPAEREAVETAERLADGTASPEQLRAALSTPITDIQGCKGEQEELAIYLRAIRTIAIPSRLDRLNTAYANSLMRLQTAYALVAALNPGEVIANRLGLDVDSHPLSEVAILLRDIFGNPFRPVVFAPEWRSLTAVALAEGMYAARDFDAMPVLADALEEAGCDSPDVLGHCRGPGPHVRGCWVVDHVLGLG